MPAIRAAVVKRMLSVYKELWAEEDAPRLGSGAFVRRVAVASLTVDPKGSARVLLSAGNLFAGHAIELQVTRLGKVQHVHLA